MKKFLFISFFSLMSLFAKDGIKQEIDAGFIATTGNSDSSTVSAEYRLEYILKNKTEVKFRADMLYGKKDGETSNERYRANFNVKHYFKRNLFYYHEIYYLKNRFEGYKHQINAGFGLGYKIIDKEHELLLGLGGLVVRYNSYTSSDKDSELLSFVKASMDYKYLFDKKNSFISRLYIMNNVEKSSDYEAGIYAKLSFKLNSKIAFTTGVEVKYDNMPPFKNGKRLYKTDTTTKVGITYFF